MRLILSLIFILSSAFPTYADYTAYEQQRLAELQELLRKAESNDAKAQEEIGRIFENGNDLVERNTEEAYFWYTLTLKNLNGDVATLIEKADKGSPYAAEEVCSTLAENAQTKAFDACKRYAEGGFPLAQGLLCHISLMGNPDLKPNVEEAAKWCKRYSLSSKEYLGILYEHGLGVAQSYENAYYWYASFAEKEKFLYFSQSLRDQVAQHLSPEQLSAVKQRLISGSAPLLEVDKSNKIFCEQLPPSSSGFTQTGCTPVSIIPLSSNKLDLDIRAKQRTWKPDDYNRYMSVKERIKNRQPRTELIQIISAADVSAIRAKAEAGDPDAEAKLYTLYIYGRGVPKDRAKAFEWCSKAAEHGHAEAQLHMAGFYNWGNEVPKSPEEGTRWYRKAAENGYVRAQKFLGDRYFRAQGVEHDYAEAAKWYQKAAEGGDFDAMAALGAMFYSGKGVTQDFKKAYFWLSLFAKSDRPLRRELIILASAQMYMNPDQIAEVKKLVEEWKPTSNTKHVVE
jgi:TPR repeat protein